jgi:hypothetical protein
LLQADFLFFVMPFWVLATTIEYRNKLLYFYFVVAPNLEQLFGGLFEL